MNKGSILSGSKKSSRGLQYKIVYKKGAENGVADALSRKSTHDSHCAAISVCTPQWITEVQAGYRQDPQAQDMVSKLAIHPSSIPNFALSAGIMRYEGRIWVGANVELHNKLLHACHASALGGHSGFPVTYMRMKQIFA